MKSTTAGGTNSPGVSRRPAWRSTHSCSAKPSFCCGGAAGPRYSHDWLAERRFALDEGLRRLAAAARAEAVAGGSIEDSVLRVERTETAVPDGAADLVADLYRRLPEARITDILLEVDDATRFTEAFTHLRGDPAGPEGAGDLASRR